MDMSNDGRSDLVGCSVYTFRIVAVNYFTILVLALSTLANATAEQIENSSLVSRPSKRIRDDCIRLKPNLIYQIISPPYYKYHPCSTTTRCAPLARGKKGDLARLWTAAGAGSG
jgi:hypothetical protein